MRNQDSQMKENSKHLLTIYYAPGPFELWAGNYYHQCLTEEGPEALHGKWPAKVSQCDREDSTWSLLKSRNSRVNRTVTCSTLCKAKGRKFLKDPSKGLPGQAMSAHCVLLCRAVRSNKGGLCVSPQSYCQAIADWRSSGAELCREYAAFHMRERK